VKIVTNPILLHAVVVLFCAGVAFLFGLIVIRSLRKSISEEADFSKGATPSLETLPLHVYNTVIQQLKQQKHELDVQSKSEQQRARISETLSQAVLSNLSSGVLLFGTNGLVKTSNPAAKEILGFASATGMSAADIFRGAMVSNSTIPRPGVFPDETSGDLSADCVHLADEVDSVLHQGSKRRQAQAEYETPAGESRFLAVTISAVPAADGSLLGVACLINDQTALEDVRRQQELQGELSAERALELRTSLTTISGYAQQLACNRDPEIARQIAADIAQEASRLDRSIGGFLTQRPAAQAAGATSGG